MENVAASTYNRGDPTNDSVAHWTSGWAQPSVEPAGYTYTTGWNYVGRVNGASGTYLGYGWAVTAAHVGAGNLTLNGATYPMVPNSARPVGTSDLLLFQVSPAPALPPLILRSNDPVAYSSNAVIIGFGDGGPKISETWGQNVVTQINESITPDGYAYISNDFLTLTGGSSAGTTSVTNNYQLVVGDSGGGSFTYNNRSQNWELAGINEVSGTATLDDGSMQNFSGFVQANTYVGDIDGIIAPISDTPVLPPGGIAILAALLLAAGARTFAPTGKLSGYVS